MSFQNGNMFVIFLINKKFSNSLLLIVCPTSILLIPFLNCSLFGKYLNIHETISREDLLKINGSTEIAYNADLKVELIQGDPMNFKITTPEDLSNFENIQLNNLRTTT